MKILDTIDEDEAVHRIAETAHEVNRAYCRSIGEEDQPSWKDAEAWRRESCINGVWAIVAHPDTTPEQSHNNWVNQKLQDGWAWGPSKDPEKKEHPCMVPYSQLPEEQKVKDALFTAVVKSLI